jgi:hypothetical protein
MRNVLVVTVTLIVALAAGAAAEEKKPAAPSKPPVQAKAAPAPPAGTTEAEIAKGTAEARLAPITNNNAAMLSQWMAGAQDVPTGMACPKCGGELLRNVKIVLATTPTMSIVRCPACQFVTALF